MHTLGRIIMLVVGVILVGLYIQPFIANINSLITLGWPWGQMFASEENTALFAAFFTYCVYMLAAAAALLTALRGKSTLFAGLISLIMLGFVIWVIVSANNAGKLVDFWSVFQVVVGVLLPICYFLGCFFLWLAPHRK